MGARGRRRRRQRVQRVVAVRIGPALAAAAGRLGGHQPGVLRRRAVSALPDLGAKKATVHASVVYPGLRKNVRSAGDADADDHHPWRLSKRLGIQPRFGLKRGGWRLVALRFEVDKTAVGADVRVDDVLVDPRMRY
jgi:hypothetical protein